MSLDTTKDIYYKSGQYIKTRQTLHTEIIDHFYNTDVNTKTPPEAILLGGGSASGKSTLSEYWLQVYAEEFISMTHIDCDAIKFHIPDFKKMNKFNQNAAALHVHDESSDIADALLIRCIEEKQNFLYDGTMKNLNKYKLLIDKLLDNGYHIIITVVDVPIEIAKKRAHVRSLETGRHVPNEIIEESHRQVPKVFLALKELVHEYTLYDTSDDQPIEVIEKLDGHVTVYNQKRVDEFYQKSEQ